MAIQSINLGTAPNGVGGDTLRSTATKINTNFSDATHAASKLIGTAVGQIPLSEQTFKAAYLNSTYIVDNSGFDCNAMVGGDKAIIGATGNSNLPTNLYNGSWYVECKKIYNGSNDAFVQTANQYNTGLIATRYRLGNSWSVWVKYYTSANTTTDANGFIKAASPIVKVHLDKIVSNEEAELQNIIFIKNGIGDYTIETVTGLSTDGWYIELPKDMNGNPKIAVTLTEDNSVITLKSYKRIFSMETFTFEPDLDSPLDIPVDRWVDLRLNELPRNEVTPSEIVEPSSEV